METIENTMKKSSRRIPAILITSLLLSLHSFVVGDDASYGPFDITINKAEICQGPKVKNCTTVNLRHEPGGRVLVLAMEVFEDCRPDIGKIASFTLGEKKSATPLVRLQMNKPCENLFLRPIFNMLLNATETCLVKKGLYKNKVDVAKVAADYFAGKFFYGNFYFKAVFYNKKCNFSCAKIYVSMTPKT